MRLTRIVFILLAILPALMLSCGGTATGPVRAGLSADIEVKEVIWSAGPPYETREQRYTYHVENKDEFGPEGFSGTPFFKVLRVISAEAVEVSFARSLVLSNESIGKPSAYESIVVTLEPICFKTRSYDVGAEYCLSILNAMEDGD